MNSKLRSGERVLSEESATLVGGLRNVNWVNVSGLIYITNRRLIFEPVGWPFKTDSTTIPLDSIAVVRPRNSLWFIPDSMEIETRDGDRYHFKVWSRDRLIDMIETQMNNPPPAPLLPGDGD
jgi:GRAM domain